MLLIEKGSSPVEPPLPPFLRGIVTLSDNRKYEVEFLLTDEYDDDGCRVYSYAAPPDWDMPPTAMYVPFFPAQTAVQIEGGTRE